MNPKVLITGSAGLIGSESVRFFSKKGFDVYGIDNDMRSFFFGKKSSTEWCRRMLQETIPMYRHFTMDIREQKKIEKMFQANAYDLIIHTAAQPSHDWAARDVFTDFTVNANGTLNLLENFRKYCPEAVFIFTSTNKIYGDRPNMLPVMECPTRYELEDSHHWYEGINETMPIDQCMHSLFGASKLAADILVQEYGKYFNLKTVVFRGGCLTGPTHNGAMLHGFLSYLMKCCVIGEKYSIFGYNGKQVRDNIHAYDLVNAFWHYYQNPSIGEVYNIGGSRFSNCSVMEAIDLCQQISGQKLNFDYIDRTRTGDHIWWISDISKFKSHYPEWNYQYDLTAILFEIYERLRDAEYERKIAV